MRIEIIGKMKHYKESGYGYREVERKIGMCPCGHKVELLEVTNTCVCERDYGFNGDLLAPRSQWGEETGESATDVLEAGHHQEY